MEGFKDKEEKGHKSHGVCFRVSEKPFYSRYKRDPYFRVRTRRVRREGETERMGFFLEVRLKSGMFPFILKDTASKIIARLAADAIRFFFFSQCKLFNPSKI